MNAIIYDKTDKGREEITTRKYQLAPRLRSLLVLIDGKKTIHDLLEKVSGLGLNEQSIQDLLDKELIIISSGSNSLTTQPLVESDVIIAATVATLPSEDLLLPASPQDNAVRFQILYNFFNETIKNTLGLRGYGLQLKVERAGNIQDFHELRRPYVEAVLKAKGKEMARSLRDRLDQLLFTESGAVIDKIIPDDE
ncbi:MAG: hypothetical protein Q7R66_15220 [Undibacterium sp.]|uniref:hypothetical protein n=1 Tax=Undibacterium sp. TaxID=1914977 RepID=UPI00271FA2DF|nr:hypothetical protein [Undibacterium sp.]MDO8653532.1 hypothetical protein [Undibacterium sp.]